MRDIENSISNFVELQFPEFYREEGPLFVLFAKEYFTFLETCYTYAELEVDTGFNIGDTVSQGGATGSIEAKSGKFILIRNTSSEGFKCKLKCQELIYILSSSGSQTYIESLSSPSVYYHSRNLFDYRDIDKTADYFLVYFKEKYLKGIQFNTNTSKRNLIKAAFDLFRAKGTERSIDLLFKLVFGTKAEVYYPGDDILRPSGGKWKLPVYLEVSRSSRTTSYTGKLISGSKSGAEGFVESIITRNVKGKLIDILYLSNAKGPFVAGDIITENGIIENAPVHLGSLNSITITQGGSLFVVGEIVNIVSASGISGKAIVNSISSETGIVRFTLVDGGWGYSVNATSIVSTKVLEYSNYYNSNTSVTAFTDHETVEQNLHSLGITEVVGLLEVKDFINNPSGANSVVVQSDHVLNSNSATIIVNTLANNILANGNLKIPKKQLLVVNTSIFYPVGSVVNQSNGTSLLTKAVVNAVSNVAVLTINATPVISGVGFHIGQFITQNGTGANGIVVAVPYTSYYGFTNVTHVVLRGVGGTFNNTGTLNVYPSAANLTLVSTATPNTAQLGYQILLNDSSVLPSGNIQWFANNLISNATIGNSTIIVSSDVGGIISTNTSVTATGNVIGSNSGYLGITSVNNAFYSVNGNIIVGRQSNSVATITLVSSGSGANVRVGSITDTESVRLAQDLISSNNVLNVPFYNMIINGANSGYGYLSGVLILYSGSSYSNADVVTFTGGTYSGFRAGNASIVTNSSGGITSVVLASNVGSGYSSSPSANVATSTGSGAILYPLFPLGFVKTPAGDLINDTLLNIFRFQDYTIGSIATLAGINPGENYNLAPFIRITEPAVASLGKEDVVLNVTNVNKSFIVGENIRQSVVLSGNTITSNNLVGNSSYANGELVYSTNGIRRIAEGTIDTITSSTPNSVINVLNVIGQFSNTVTASKLTVSSNSLFSPGDLIRQGTGGSQANGILVTSNNTTLIVKSVSGTFAANATAVTSSSTGSTTISAANNSFSIYQLTGSTSNCTSNILNTTVYTSIKTAKGIVRSINGNFITVRRKSLFTEFEVSSSNTLYGITSYANASVISVTGDATSNDAGDNAIVSANVITANGSISELTIFDSGLGYLNQETVDMVSSATGIEATGKANVINQGTGEGYFETSDGFLSDNKFIHDGVYYQEYSYEVQSEIPLDKYSDILKQILHVAGTNLFGKVLTSSYINTPVSVTNSSITIV